MMTLVTVSEIFLVGLIVFCTNSFGAFQAFTGIKTSCFVRAKGRFWPLILPDHS